MASCLPDTKFGALGLSLLQASQVFCESRGNPSTLQKRKLRLREMNRLQLGSLGVKQAGHWCWRSAQGISEHRWLHNLRGPGLSRSVLHRGWPLKELHECHYLLSLVSPVTEAKDARETWHLVLSTHKYNSKRAQTRQTLAGSPNLGGTQCGVPIPSPAPPTFLLHSALAQGPP